MKTAKLLLLILVSPLFAMPSMASSSSYKLFSCSNGAGIRSSEKGTFLILDFASSIGVERSFDSSKYTVDNASEVKLAISSGKSQFTLKISGQKTICTDVTSIVQDTVVDLSKSSNIVPPFSGRYEETFSQIAPTLVSQQSPQLSDLFSSTGVSNLCGPAAAAQGLIYLQTKRRMDFPKLEFGNPLLSGPTVDKSALVRELAKNCGTDADGGTHLIPLAFCLNQTLLDSGYQGSDVRVIGPGADSFSVEGGGWTPMALPKNVNTTDVVKYLQSGYAVLLKITYHQLNHATNRWSTSNGHIMSVVGYARNSSWGPSRVLLQVLNPMKLPNGKSSLVDEVWMVEGQGEWRGTYTLHGPGATLSFTSTVDGLLVFRPE